MYSKITNLHYTVSSLIELNIKSFILVIFSRGNLSAYSVLPYSKDSDCNFSLPILFNRGAYLY